MNSDLKRVSNNNNNNDHGNRYDDDPFLRQYQPSDLRITSEFLSTWLPFLSRDLCQHCTQILSDRVRSLHSELDDEVDSLESNKFETFSSVKAHENCCNDSFDQNSNGSAKDGDDTNSLGSWKDGANGLSEIPVAEASTSGILEKSPYVRTPSPRLSWADMVAQEDELVDEEEEPESNASERVVTASANSPGELMIAKAVDKPKLSRDEREYIRFMNVKRKKDYMCLERVNGKHVNIVSGLELHTGVFSAAEQKRIVDYVHALEKMGKNKQLKARTFTAPRKWKRGKGRVTIQFGCCYNYATDKNGNPPGILQREAVDPIPHLFKVIIRRLVGWHVLPPSCVPDSCIVNIYDEGDCIPPHIDNHDFVRPFCTVSFVSECNILFGTDLKAIADGEFSGDFAIPLPVGSVLVLNGNGADVAKHCVPSVPTKRISITFRKMDETKRPIGFVPEPDLQGIQPLSFEENRTERVNSPKSEGHRDRCPIGRESKTRGYAERYSRSGPHYSTWSRQGPAYKRGPM